MDSPTRFSPRLEELEDRALPNSLLGLQDAFAGTPFAAGADGLANLFSPIGRATPVVIDSSTAAAQDASGKGPADAPAAPAPTLSGSPLQAAAVSAAASPRDNGNLNPGILPVQSDAFGATYGEWSARWWEYALSIPVSHSPFLDQTGADFAVGQSGKVWYLSGGFEFSANGQPPAGNLNVLDRTVTLPAGKALFFPILNSETDNVVQGGPNTNFTVAQLRGFAKTQQDLAENMFAQIDGHSVLNVPQYRVTSPVFSYTLPDNNISGVPAQFVSPAVADGVFLMVTPLSAGQHTIHFGGDFGPGNFALDITYHITVGNK